MKKMLLGFIIISSLIISCLAGSAFAAMDMKDTSWVLNANGSINAGKFGRQKVAGYLFVDFNASGYVTLTDEKGYYLTGSYGFDSANKFFIDISEDSIKNFILDNVGVASDYVDIDVTSTVNKTTLKGTSLSFSLNFTVILDVYGYDKPIKISYSLKSTGNFNDRDGSSWQIDKASVNFKLGKVKYADESTLLLHFGPNVNEGLGRNEFITYKANGNTWDYLFGGYYTRSKNKVTFIINRDNFNELLDENASKAIQGTDFNYASVWDFTATFTATVKDDVGITFKSTSKFVCDLSNDYDSVDWKGSYSVSGKGVPIK